jgi:hypothetical protein
MKNPAQYLDSPVSGRKHRKKENQGDKPPSQLTNYTAKGSMVYK